MSEITLEKIDIIRERTDATYADAKEALEFCEGNVVDALINIEEKQKNEKNQVYATKEEFLNWIKEIIKKGNVTRIKIKKDEKVMWKCENCGYIHEGASAPEKCPACIHPQAHFEMVCRNY